MVPLAAWALSRRKGLARSIRVGATMCLFAAVLRSVPILFGQQGRANTPWIGLALTHIAQTTNAAVAPLVVASPAYLSRWGSRLGVTQQKMPLSMDPRVLYRGYTMSVISMSVLSGLQFPLTNAGGYQHCHRRRLRPTAHCSPPSAAAVRRPPQSRQSSPVAPHAG